VLSAALLPVAVACDLCETLGFESGLNKRLNEAPLFYGLFVALLACAAALVPIPGLPPLKFIFLSQVANGVLLPIQLWLMLMLVNNSKFNGRAAEHQVPEHSRLLDVDSAGGSDRSLALDYLPIVTTRLSRTYPEGLACDGRM
jgi:Mn2+/Fe2+ NRAMP family transporter